MGKVELLRGKIRFVASRAAGAESDDRGFVSLRVGLFLLCKIDN